MLEPHKTSDHILNASCPVLTATSQCYGSGQISTHHKIKTL